MELVFRLAAVAMFATVAVLLIRRDAPALAPLLSGAAALYIFSSALGLLRPAVAFAQRAARISGLGGVYLVPVFKCVVIGILAKAAGEVCRDGGQQALAGAVETGAAAAALYVALPLLETLLDLLESLLS